MVEVINGTTHNNLSCGFGEAAKPSTNRQTKNILFITISA